MCCTDSHFVPSKLTLPLSSLSLALAFSDKFKVNALKSVHAKRSLLSKKVPQFWSNSLFNCEAFAAYIDPVDKECLGFLEVSFFFNFFFFFFSNLEFLDADVLIIDLSSFSPRRTCFVVEH